MNQDVILRKVNKIYPNGFHAVYDFDIEIEKGEFICLAGPSGCGKSTTLRMVAGLEDISSGDLIINGKKVNDVAPKDRDIAMVFQNYALYAHMSVYHNMAFSLTIRKVDPAEIHEKVMKAADVLGLIPYLNRKPKQLSGGQRQRVAVGRAIVRNPVVFLLDEPLSNLDAKLRGTMRKELMQLHKKLNATFLYVTHDQIEALTLATRIVVMKDGHVHQIASPKEMFDTPEDKFVAGFIGTPPMNFLSGKIDSNIEYFIHNETGTKIKLTDAHKAILKNYADTSITLAIRAEYIYIADKVCGEENTIDLTCDYSEYLGSYNLVYGKYGNENVEAELDENGKPLSDEARDALKYMNKIICKIFTRNVDVVPGQKIKVAFDMSKVLFFDDATSKRVR